jgi:hypothetical protein
MQHTLNSDRVENALKCPSRPLVVSSPYRNICRNGLAVQAHKRPAQLGASHAYSYQIRPTFRWHRGLRRPLSESPTTRPEPGATPFTRLGV